MLVLASLVFLRGLLPAHDQVREESHDAEPPDVGWTWALLLLGVIAFCSFVGEGSASDWSAVYMTQELGTSEALGAVAFAAFAVTMAAARFAADPLRTRLGNVPLVRGGSLIAAAGLAAGLLIHEPWAGIAGFALLGLGLAAVVPIAFSAAGDLDPRATGRLVGRVATIGYVGSVAGPIMIGWLAEATSLRTALAWSSCWRWRSPRQHAAFSRAARRPHNPPRRQLERCDDSMQHGVNLAARFVGNRKIADAGDKDLALHESALSASRAYSQSRSCPLAHLARTRSFGS